MYVSVLGWCVTADTNPTATEESWPNKQLLPQDPGREKHDGLNNEHW